jgi:hypothetical protein
MTKTVPGRRLWLLHLACGVPLIALALWFGMIDRLPFGERRCSSCGVEGYVIAAHVAAAAWLAAVTALAAAARRRLTQGTSAPGSVTVAALAAVAVFAAASLVRHQLFSVPAFAAMIASVALLPLAGLRWLIVLISWRRPTVTDSELRQRATGTLVAAWVSLTLLLPAVFAWVWTDRVEWIVF